MIVSQLWQYPVKGLAGMTLDSIRLEAGKHFPGDRRFAVTNGHPNQDEALACHNLPASQTAPSPTPGRHGSAWAAQPRWTGLARPQAQRPTRAVSG